MGREARRGLERRVRDPLGMELAVDPFLEADPAHRVHVAGTRAEGEPAEGVDDLRGVVRERWRPAAGRAAAMPAGAARAAARTSPAARRKRVVMGASLTFWLDRFVASRVEGGPPDRTCRCGDWL